MSLPQPAEDGPFQAHLLHRGREAIRSVYHRLLELRHKPEWQALREPVNQVFRLAQKDTTVEDHEAESAARRELEKLYPTHRHIAIEAIGEERMKSAAWKSHRGLQGLDQAKRTIALVDPLDGTKLEAREIPTWCIAVIFYDRDTGRILASLVGQATGSVYLAVATPITADKIDPESGDASKNATAWRQVPNPNAPRRDGWLDLLPPEPLQLLAPETPDHAHVAFVAPTPRAFLHAARFVEKAHSSDPKLLGRVYNMGGNPMLAKVADGTIDAVVGFGDVSDSAITAQKPHDYIPGAFIAQQAGAVVIDLDTGDPLRFEDQLLQPDKHGKRYIVARTSALADRCLIAMRDAGLTQRA